MFSKAKHNFEIGQIWISINREKYRIVSISDNINNWFPILAENISDGFIYTSNLDGQLFNNMSYLGDKMIMVVGENFYPSLKEKDVADRMLKVYNAKMDRIKKDRQRSNRDVLRDMGKNPKK